MSGLIMMNISSSPVRVLTFAGIPLTDLTWVPVVLALLSLIISLVALGRTRRLQAAAAPAVAPVASAVPAATSQGDNPALIAVLTAAVAMILAEEQSAGQQAARVAGPVSPAGFTIRQVRRV